jgi:hypothetical protein
MIFAELGLNGAIFALLIDMKFLFGFLGSDGKIFD